MINKIKLLLHRLGVYEWMREGFIKVYYPYKNYKIRREASEILTRVCNVFENNTKDYWLDYGTLLGYVRERRIIKGDLDLDFGVIMEDKNKSLQEYLREYQIYPTQQMKVEGMIVTEQYRYKNIGFDIFYYRKENDKIITNVWLTTDHSVPQRISYEQGGGVLGETTFSAFDTTKIQFYGVSFRTPKDADLYLKEHYGDDYMIPNPNFSFDDEKNRVEVNKNFEVIFYE